MLKVLRLARSDHPKQRFGLLLSLLLVVGVSASGVTGWWQFEQSRTMLKARSATLASLVDAEKVRLLSIGPGDEQLQDYVDLKQKLKTTVLINKDVQYAYLVAKNSDGLVFFLVDSETQGATGYAAPGKFYNEAPSQLTKLFSSGTPAGTVYYRDQKGAWIGGLAPIVNTKSGEVVAVAGVNISAQDFVWRSALASTVPMLVSMVAVVVLLLQRRELDYKEALLDQKSAFVAIAAHDMRSPMVGVNWGISLIQKLADPMVTPQVKTLLEREKESISQVINTLNSTLDTIALDKEILGKSHHKNKVDVVPLLEVAIKVHNMSAEAKKVGLLTGEGSLKSATVNGVAIQLQHAISNLLDCSLKYANEDSVVTCTVDELNDQVVLSSTFSNDKVDAADLDQIINGEYHGEVTKDTPIRGTGLGLMLVQEVARQHNGKLVVEQNNSRLVLSFIISKG